MAFCLARNMSIPPKHRATIQPIEIRPRRESCDCSRIVLADLGLERTRRRSTTRLATWLLQCLGEPRARDPVEALRDRIECETTARGMAGCAMVKEVTSNYCPWHDATICRLGFPTLESGDAGAPPQDSQSIANLALALVLLSKSSNVVWVARKTPVLDVATLRRRLITRDPRFLGELP